MSNLPSVSVAVFICFLSFTDKVIEQYIALQMCIHFFKYEHFYKNRDVDNCGNASPQPVKSVHSK